MAVRKVHPRKIRIKVWSVMICTVMLIASGYFLLNIYREVKTTVTLTSDVATARQQLQDLQAENVQLNQEVEKLQNNDYVCSYARSRYLIVNNQEQVLQLPSAD